MSAQTLHLPCAESPNGSRAYGPSFADAEDAQRWAAKANENEGDGSTRNPWTVQTITAGAAVHPAGYAGECASCQEHAELFHAQHDEDRHRMPPPLPFCRPCAEYALIQLQAEQAQIEQEDEAYAAHLDAEAARTAPLEEERHRQNAEAFARWADAQDAHDRERADAYARELRQDDEP